MAVLIKQIYSSVVLFTIRGRSIVYRTSGSAFSLSLSLTHNGVGWKLLVDGKLIRAIEREFIALSGILIAEMLSCES